jgi:hypothetical protein
MREKQPPSRAFTAFAILAIVLSIAVTLGMRVLVPIFAGIFTQLGADLPLLTRFFLATYSYLWLDTVLSSLIWLLVYRHQISEALGLTFLQILQVLTLAYCLVGVYSCYLPMFKVFDKMG